MRTYLFSFSLFLGIICSFSGYADEICPQNKDIFEYKAKIKNNFHNIKPDIAYELSKKLDKILEDLSDECAEKLVNQGVDEELFQAGFPALITSIASEILIDSLENILLGGDHQYFVKDNERTLGFLKYEIEKINEKNFDSIYKLDKWHQIHDFVLAARFSSEIDSSLEEMQIQAKRAYNPLNYALYLPVWQGKKRREYFLQLCLELGCMPDSSQECSPKIIDDLWYIKAKYFANEGDLSQTIYACNFWGEIDNDSDETPLLSLGRFMEYAINFRRIGILNSNCNLGKQLKYIELQGLYGADNCININNVLGILDEE